MTNSTRIELIRMFNKVLASPSSGNKVAFLDMNKKAVPNGYIVHPDACYDSVFRFLAQQHLNPNSTFYKSWQDIVSKSKVELWEDQILHYWTTYGTGFAYGNGYVPNAEADFIPYSTYKYILPATREELFNDCYDILKSGIALSSNTIDCLLDYINSEGFLKDVDVNQIKNKEAQCILCAAKGVLPYDEFGMLRVFVYGATGSAMVIKSKESIRTIKQNAFKLERLLLSLEQDALKRLSRIFLRFKPIFLAMKTPHTSKVINRLRRYAEEYHTPLKAGFWETILNPASKEEVFARLPEELGKITNFKKLQVMQGIEGRVNSHKSNGRLFTIRNGKTFVREDYKAPTDIKYLLKLYMAIEDSVVESLRGKACKYKTHKGVEFAAPTSEKNFLGNYPMGTSIELGKSGVVGIYWRNEWGVHDYDLHYTSMNGMSYGWCYAYKDKNIVFSGDMVNADPEAAECFLFKDEAPDGRLSVNIFSGYGKGRKLRFFVAEASENNISKINMSSKYGRRDKTTPMVDPDTIKFDSFVQFGDDEEHVEKNLGYVLDNKIYLIDATCGSRAVSNANRNSIIQEQFKITCQSYVKLNRLLDKAGFERVGEDEDAELDLVNPEKDSLIKLFS